MAESNDNQLHAGISLDGSQINCLLIDAQGSIVERKEIQEFDQESVLPRLTALLEDLAARHSEIKRAGLAVPGLVESTGERVAFSMSFPGHAEMDVVKELSSSVGIQIVLENDANAAALGEYHFGAAKGAKNLFYATLGKGVGGAFIIDGKIWRGASGFAGEFGYLTLNSEGIRLEDVASSENIIRRTRSRFHQDSTSSLNSLSEDQITLEEIIAAAEREDDFAQMMLERTGTYVGTGIAAVINLLNVEVIVIGGAIMKASHLVLDAIVRRARELSFAPAFRSTSILEGRLGRDAAAIGAALSAGIQQTER